MCMCMWVCVCSWYIVSYQDCMIEVDKWQTDWISPVWDDEPTWNSNQTNLYQRTKKLAWYNRPVNSSLKVVQLSWLSSMAKEVGILPWLAILGLSLTPIHQIISELDRMFEKRQNAKKIIFGISLMPPIHQYTRLSQSLFRYLKKKKAQRQNA